ncbi:hypothetical protein YQE_12973, partial [Dendroctonus ponderosae]
MEYQKKQAKTCGICFEAISQNSTLFGVLPNCSHCFCFTCIQRWRQSKDFDVSVSRACPECRTVSNFVYPSRVWFEHKADKEKFILREKNRRQTIDCQFFRKGRGKCPFGNTCLYLHALPNGKKLDVGPPKQRRRRTASYVDFDVVQEIIHWLNDESDEFFDFQLYEPHDIRGLIAFDSLIDTDSDAESLDSECALFI